MKNDLTSILEFNNILNKQNIKLNTLTRRTKMLAIVPALILASGLSVGAVDLEKSSTASFEELNNNQYTIVVSDISELSED